MLLINLKLEYCYTKRSYQLLFNCSECCFIYADPNILAREFSFCLVKLAFVFLDSSNNLFAK